MMGIIQKKLIFIWHFHHVRPYLICPPTNPTWQRLVLSPFNGRGKAPERSDLPEALTQTWQRLIRPLVALLSF